MKFFTDLHGPQRMNHNYIGDLLALSSTTTGQIAMKLVQTLTSAIGSFLITLVSPYYCHHEGNDKIPAKLMIFQSVLALVCNL